MTDTVEVTQADREAAAKFWAIGEKHFKSGEGDCTRIVQAFAHHRHEATRELRDLVATLYCASGCDCCRDTETWEATAAKLAEKLEIPPYDDGSGFDFYTVRDEALAKHTEATQ